MIDADPGFVRNPSTGDYGDLHLASQSIAAYNAGDNALAVDPQGGSLGTDLDGNSRIVFGVVDAGAYEYQSSRLAGDANDDGKVDAADVSIMAANWGAENATWAMGNFNDDTTVDKYDAAILAANWGTTTEPTQEESAPIAPSDPPSMGPLPADPSATARRLIQPAARENSLFQGASTGESAAACDAVLADETSDKTDSDEQVIEMIYWQPPSRPTATALHRLVCPPPRQRAVDIALATMWES